MNPTVALDIFLNFVANLLQNRREAYSSDLIRCILLKTTNDKN